LRTRQKKDIKAGVSISIQGDSGKERRRLHKLFLLGGATTGGKAAKEFFVRVKLFLQGEKTSQWM